LRAISSSRISPNGQRHDNPVLFAEEAVDLTEGVAAIVEADEEAFFALGAAHGGLERVDVRPAGFFFLLTCSA